MVNKQILDYVQKSLEGGYSIEQISPGLLGQGWSLEDIKEAAMKASEIINQKTNIPTPPAAPVKKSGSNFELKNLSASQILLYLGALIVVLAGVIYVGINWSQWGSLARIFAIFLPTLICYAAGTWMWFSDQHKQQGMAFLIAGSILFPFFLSVVFREMAIFSMPFNDQFNFVLSLLTFLMYFVCSFIFRNPVWVFLYHGVGVFLFGFFLKLIGVDDFFTQPTMAWLFLIPGTAYLFLSLFYDNIKQDEAGGYSCGIGALVILFSFLRLFAETSLNNKQDLAWLLLLFGVIYFLIGIFYEEKGYKKYSSAPYIIGAGVVFFSLFRLGIDGTLLKSFIPSVDQYSQNILGWSNVIVGVIYLLVAYSVSQLKHFQFKEGSRYEEFFNLVGPFWILGAIFYLGLGGHKPVYETLLLLLSLGFIFGSIPTLVRQYLLVGTLFLIIYIFSIGDKYFQNQVGWPITLFVAGLISMGISVLMEKIRRKYFAIGTPKV